MKGEGGVGRGLRGREGIEGKGGGGQEREGRGRERAGE